MKYEDLKVGMKVCDGYWFGYVEKIYKKTVHVRWSNEYMNGKWIYDLDHLQFLEKTK